MIWGQKTGRARRARRNVGCGAGSIQAPLRSISPKGIYRVAGGNAPGIGQGAPPTPKGSKETVWQPRVPGSELIRPLRGRALFASPLPGALPPATQSCPCRAAASASPAGSSWMRFFLNLPSPGIQAKIWSTIRLARALGRHGLHDSPRFAPWRDTEATRFLAEQSENVIENKGTAHKATTPSPLHPRRGISRPPHQMWRGFGGGRSASLCLRSALARSRR